MLYFCEKRSTSEICLEVSDIFKYLLTIKLVKYGWAHYLGESLMNFVPLFRSILFGRYNVFLQLSRLSNHE